MGVLQCRGVLERVHGYHTVVICEKIRSLEFQLEKLSREKHTISCQEDEGRQYAVWNVVKRRYGINEVKVIRIIRVSVVARPSLS